MASDLAAKLASNPAPQPDQGEDGVAYWERAFAALSPADRATLDGLAVLDRQYGDDFEREDRERAKPPSRPR